jgi:hypothetical protein
MAKGKETMAHETLEKIFGERPHDEIVRDNERLRGELREARALIRDLSERVGELQAFRKTGMSVTHKEILLEMRNLFGIIEKKLK